MLTKNRLAYAICLVVLCSTPARSQVTAAPDRAGRPGPEPTRLQILELTMHKELVQLESELCSLQQRYEQAPTRDNEDAVVRSFLAFASTRVGLEKRLAQWREEMPRSYAARVASGTHQLRLASLARDQRPPTDAAGNAARNSPSAAGRHVAKARRYFEAALSINARVSRAWSQMIEVATSSGDEPTSAGLAARALAVLPHSFEVRSAYLLSLQPARGGSMRAAKAFIDSSRGALAPGDFALLAAHADLIAADDLMRADKLLEANAAYSRAASAGEQWRMLYGRGVSWSRLGRDESALADVSRALQLRPESPSLLLQRSSVYRALGKPDAALADLNAALALDPRDHELRNARAWLLLAHLRRADDALADARKLVRMLPSRSDAWQTYGAVLLWGKKDSHAAGDAFAHAIAAGPRNTDAWFGYGQALYSQGNGGSLDAFDTYAGLCSHGARCDEDDQAWLRRFLHDPFTYAHWPRIFLKWRLLAQLL